MHHQFRIQPRHDLTHGADQWLRCLIGRDDLDERPIAIARELAVGLVDDHRRRPIHVQRHVADDADNLQLAARNGNALPRHLLVRHVREGLCREVRAHDRTPRRTRVVAIIEDASGKERNADGREERRR